MSAPDLMPLADRASGLSSLLEPINAPRDSRRRLLRLVLVVEVASAVIWASAMTVTRSWPAVFVFDLLYLAHDVLYLPLKGWLWTAWFPWCLALWVPVMGMLALSLWGWIVGADPSRWAQRRVIVWLITSPIARPWGIGALVGVARTAQAVGLAAGFLRAVVGHGAREALDDIEHRLLSHEPVPPRTIERTLRFVDAEFRLAQLLPGHAGVTGYVYDLALLSHASEAGTTAARARLAAVCRDTAALPSPHGDMLRAWLDRRTLKDELERTVASYDRLDGWMRAAGGTARGATLPKHPPDLRGTVLEFAGFALFPAVDASWADAGDAMLHAIDRLWTALMLGSGTAAHAAVLAEDIRRARLATCRELGRRRHQASSAPVTALWQAPADPLASGPLRAIAAGGEQT